MQASLGMMRHVCWVLIVTASTLIACLEDDPEPRTREQFCRDWASAACNAEIVSVCQAADAESCRSSQEDFCRELAPAEFAGERSDRCIEAVAAAYRDGDLSASELRTVRLLAAPCDELSRGTRGPGQSCLARDDCNSAAGYDCVLKGNRMSGRCEIPEPVGAGEDCESDRAVCPTGFFCNGENCIAGRAPGAACMHHEECGTAGYCDVDGVCAARRAIGAACDDDAQCARGICYEFGDERVCTDRVVLTRTEPICEDLR